MLLITLGVLGNNR